MHDDPRRQPTNGANSSTSVTAGRDAPIVHVSLEDFPERDRFEAWREIVGRAVMRLEVERLPDLPPKADWTVRVMPDVCFNDGVGTGLQFHRTPALIDDDDLAFHISLGGGFRAHGKNVDIVPRKGEAMLIPGGEPFRVSLQDEKFFVFRVPSRVLSPIIRDLDAVLWRPIPKETEALRLLVKYADTVRRMTQFARPDVRQAVASHMHDLIALALGADRDATELANGRGVRAARLCAIKADIAAHIAEADLAIGQIATRHRLSPRYVQMLFESEGTTFSEFVRGERLRRAHRMLTDPRFVERSIISVALDAGFQDLSYFNRSFRRRFGATPSHVRAAAAR